LPGLFVQPLSRGEQAGFTLIEVLVATTLLALLSFMLLGGIQLGARVMDKGAAYADRQSALATASDFVRAQLTALQPLARPASGGTAPLAFEGRADGVSFVSLASPYQAVGGSQALALHTLAQAGGLGLVADWRPYRPQTEEENDARASVLLDHLASVEFAYFGLAGSDDAALWHADWVDQPALPALIRLRLVFLDGRRPPDLLVAPRLSSGDHR
jgi:general secretion pathway protein J